MILDPLHPAVVHFPIVLATALPFFVLWAFVSIRRGATPRRAWVPVIVVSVLLTTSTFVATATGEAQEERVEAVVPESAFEEHEEAGERLRLLAGVATLLLAFGLLESRVGAGARWIGAAGTLIVLAATVQAGHSGGEMVYRHGAAAAYTAPVQMDDDDVLVRREDHERDDDGR